MRKLSIKKIILQDVKHDDNIDSYGVDWPRWWKYIIVLVQISCIITSKFNQFKCACYKHKLTWFIYLAMLSFIT